MEIFRKVKKLYVGNLAWGVSDDDLQNVFSEYGSVASAVVITDRETGRSRGFGFVELEDGADQAIEALNGQDLQDARCALMRPKARVAVVAAAVTAAADVHFRL